MTEQERKKYQRAHKIAAALAGARLAESTVAKYERLARSYDKSGCDTPEGYADHRGLSKRSYYVLRAALARSAAIRFLASWGSGSVSGVHAAAVDLSALQPGHKRVVGLYRRRDRDRPVLESSRGFTKRHGLADLTRRRPRWRLELFFQVLADDKRCDSDHALAISILTLSGCRPSDLKKCKVWISDTREALYIAVKSSKHSSLTRGGQDWHCIRISPVSNDPSGLDRVFEFLKSRAEQLGGEVLIGLSNSEQRAVRRAIESAAARVGLRHLRSTHKISSYSLRHAFVADLRASGHLDREAAARALGHSSTRTFSLYGSHFGSRRGIRVERATSSGDIRIRHSQSLPPELQSSKKFFRDPRV